MTRNQHNSGSSRRAIHPLGWKWSRSLPWIAGIALCGALLLAGCTSSQHRQAADKEAYGIIQQKQKKLFGKTNEFNIDTRYSARDPKHIPGVEIIQERLMSAQRKLTLPEALQIAVTNSRTYQFNKEKLYIEALNLSNERYSFGPQPFLTSKGSVNRETTGEYDRELNSQLGFTQFLQSGGRIGLTLFNDVLRYYTGNSASTATTKMSVSLFQPLLRGAGAEIAAESLTQQERKVIYEVRNFTHFQNTFAVDIVTAYYRILQQKDAVINAYTNYSNLVMSRERAQALAYDRLPAFQADQARQDELRAKSTYILAVDRYRSLLDTFKITLGLPLGVEISLDDSAFQELKEAGLIPLSLSEQEGYRIAVDNRLDLINEIDQFEDAKRKIKVAASKLKAGLDFVADASLASNGTADYTKFNGRNYQAGAGLQLNLPIDRLPERNAYRTTIINFERQIRTLNLALDNARNDVRTGLRTLEQTRQNYYIQKVAAELADRRVESATLLLQAGRAQIRDLLDAQSSQLTAQNAVTQALVDYHVARLGLLVDLGKLDSGAERFWLKEISVSSEPPVAPGKKTDGEGEVIPPKKIFGE